MPITPGFLKDTFCIALPDTHTTLIPSTNLDPVKVFPNPAGDFISIDASQLNQGATFILYDVFGKEIQTNTLSSTLNAISISELKPGCYLYKVLSNDRTQSTGKLVKL